MSISVYERVIQSKDTAATKPPAASDATSPASAVKNGSSSSVGTGTGESSSNALTPRQAKKSAAAALSKDASSKLVAELHSCLTQLTNTTTSHVSTTATNGTEQADKMQPGGQAASNQHAASTQQTTASSQQAARCNKDQDKCIVTQTASKTISSKSAGDRDAVTTKQRNSTSNSGTVANTVPPNTNHKNSSLPQQTRPSNPQVPATLTASTTGHTDMLMLARAYSVKIGIIGKPT